MYFSVADLLQAPAVHAADPEVLAGETQLRRRLTWIHPAEVSDIAYLIKPDELIITSWSFLPLTEEGIRAYVASLASANATGIMVELGRRFPEVPEPIVAAIRETDMVLIALRQETRFAHIVEEVGALIHNSRVSELRAQEEVYDTFSRLTAAGADPAALVTAATELSGLPVVLESLGHRVIAYDLSPANDAAVLLNWERRSRRLLQSERIKFHETEGWLVGLIGTQGDEWGRLVLVTGRAPDARESLIQTQTALALSSSRFRSVSQDGLEREASLSLLQRLTEGDTSLDVQLRCEAQGLILEDRTFVAIAVRPRLGPSAADERNGLRDVSALIATLRRAHDSMVLWPQGDHAVALVGMTARGSRAQLRERLDAAMLPLGAVTAAMSETVPSFEQVPSALQSAVNFLTVAGNDGQQTWLTVKDLHLRWLLQALESDERLRMFVQRELGVLIEMDAQRGTSHIDTLRTVIETAGGKQLAAQRLFISRPTLYGRIARIEEILGVDLSDPLTQTSLHAALLALDFVQSAAADG